MKLWTVGGAARELEVAPETLREYEKKGLVKPMRDTSGRRLLTDEDLDMLRRYRESRRGRGTFPAGR